MTNLNECKTTLTEVLVFPFHFIKMKLAPNKIPINAFFDNDCAYRKTQCLHIT